MYKLIILSIFKYCSLTNVVRAKLSILKFRFISTLNLGLNRMHTNNIFSAFEVVFNSKRAGGCLAFRYNNLNCGLKGDIEVTTKVAVKPISFQSISKKKEKNTLMVFVERRSDLCYQFNMLK